MSIRACRNAEGNGDVIYSNQTGGFATLHPEVEGFFVALRTFFGFREVYAMQTLCPSGLDAEVGRRWPNYMLLKSNIGVLSRAKWTVCEMREIVSAAAFDPKDEAPPFNTYCPSDR